MKFGVVNKSTIVNTFFVYTLQRNITRLAVITRNTNRNLGILKRGNWKRAKFSFNSYLMVVFINSKNHIVPDGCCAPNYCMLSEIEIGYRQKTWCFFLKSLN